MNEPVKYQNNEPIKVPTSAIVVLTCVALIIIGLGYHLCTTVSHPPQVATKSVLLEK